MNLGLATANTVPSTEPVAAVELAQAAETAGFDSIWTVEHVVWPRQYESAYPYHPSGKMPGDSSIPIPDPLMWLAWVGAHTTTIRLGTGVVILPQRNPLVLAKEVATLDRLTGGRIDLGVGVGWLEEEFAALGVPFAGRGPRTDEHIEAMRVLWGRDGAEYSGRFVAFSGVSSNPKPAQGTVPIVIGGHSEAAARRAGRLGDGFYPGPGSIQALVDVVATMRRHAEQIGRDPASIEVSAAYPGKLFDEPGRAVEAMRAAGVDRLMIHAFHVTRPSLTEGVGRIVDEVMPHL